MAMDEFRRAQISMDIAHKDSQRKLGLGFGESPSIDNYLVMIEAAMNHFLGPANRILQEISPHLPRDLTALMPKQALPPQQIRFGY